MIYGPFFAALCGFPDWETVNTGGSVGPIHSNAACLEATVYGCVAGDIVKWPGRAAQKHFSVNITKRQNNTSKKDIKNGKKQ